MGKYYFYFQLALIVLMFYFGSFAKIISNGFLALPFALSALLGLWSFYNLGSDIYSPFPEPRKNHKIIQKGPYKYIRHPMYTSVILIGLFLFISEPSFTGFIVLMLLMYVTDEKAKLEEELLAKLHEEYKDYQVKTKKFIPLIY